MKVEISYSENLRLERQLRFIVEIDRIKNILRKSKLFDGSRFENDAEHSWSICVMAIVLHEYSNFKIDLAKVVKMLLIHDIVEADAGDTFLYSKERQNVFEKEELAAKRLFGILDADQKNELIQLWNEFEERKSNEAKFAAVFDRLEPILQNYINMGYTWKENKITYDMVIEKNRHINDGSEEIWNFVLWLLNKAVEKGYLQK